MRHVRGSVRSVTGAKRLLTALMVFLVATLAAGTGYAQKEAPLTESARSQISEILALKKSLTPAEQKMSTGLAVRHRRESGRLTGAAARIAAAPAAAAGTLLVDIRATVSSDLLASITAAGGTVIHQSPRYRRVRAEVPFTLIATLAARPDVSSVREADRAVTNAGAVTSQGYISHTADRVVKGLGISGLGVKVGVLSDSASPACIKKLVASGDLPARVTVLPGQEGKWGNDEGCAMMEIIHDLAPGAELYFATADRGEAAFAENITALAATGCSVIVDDISYSSEGAFQDGIIARAVNDFAAHGGLYFSSAANSGNLTSGTSGTWEGDFVDGGAVTGPIADAGETGTVHSFGSLTYNTLTAAGFLVTLQWSDPLGGSANDYDLFVLNADGTKVKDFSIMRQTGTEDPIEFVGNVNIGDRLVIVRYRGEPRALRLDTFRGQLALGTAGSTFGHNAGKNTIGVAATSWNSARTGTRPFTGFANRIETFSSDGPRKIFYHPDGTPITPGNVLFGTKGGETLLKPDITAADGVSCKTPWFEHFYGTSAAAPHAAAIAALLKSAKPYLTGSQVRDALFKTALDTMAPGPDRDSGYGIVMALRAILAP